MWFFWRYAALNHLQRIMLPRREDGNRESGVGSWEEVGDGSRHSSRLPTADCRLPTSVVLASTAERSKMYIPPRVRIRPQVSTRVSMVAYWPGMRSRIGVTRFRSSYRNGV